jgi:hypothetical protein
MLTGLLTGLLDAWLNKMTDLGFCSQDSRKRPSLPQAALAFQQPRLTWQLPQLSDGECSLLNHWSLGNSSFDRSFASIFTLHASLEKSQISHVILIHYIYIYI